MSISRIGQFAAALAFALLPLYPSFITLTGVAFPGISLLPRPLAIVVLALAIAVALAMTAAVLVSPRAPMTLQRELLAFFGAGALAYALGIDHRDGFVFMIVMLMIIAWFANIDRFGHRAEYLRSIWWAYLSTGAVACAAAVAMVLLREPAELYRIGNGRAVGTFVLPGELAGYCIFLIPIAYAIARTSGERALRIVAWLACASGLAAMLFSFSRTGWIGLAVAIGVLVAVRSPRGGVVRAGAVVVAALAVVLMLFNEHHNPSENFTRLSIWQAAIGIIDRFPLTGVGPFGFSKIYPLVRLPDGDATAFHAHSLYLTFFAELGIVGLAAFLWLLFAYTRMFVARLPAAAADPALVATAIAAGVAGCLVQGLIDTVSVVIFGLLFPMLALSLVVARRAEPAA